MRPVTSLTYWIKEEARRLGFSEVGICRVEPSDHARFYLSWLASGHHGEMAWLARPDAVERRLHPELTWPELQSAIVLADAYEPAREGTRVAPSSGTIARYAQGRDYHRVIGKKLKRLLHAIEAHVGRSLPHTRRYVDTGPLLERELASKAGLGWQAQNTMLIHPRKGSYFFLASLLVELDLEPDEPFTADRCGRCHACLDACPTGALLGRDQDGAPVIDARRCISYLTIEHRGPIPAELRSAIGNRVFGCDICQEVCPFNARFAQEPVEVAYRARAPREPTSRADIPRPALPGTVAPSLVHLLETALDETRWDAYSQGSAIRRTGRAGFARNVCVAIGNWFAHGGESPTGDAVAALGEALQDDEPVVRGHAAWALGQIGSANAFASLRRAALSDRDDFVRDELERALQRYQASPD